MPNFVVTLTASEVYFVESATDEQDATRLAREWSDIGRFASAEVQPATDADKSTVDQIIRKWEMPGPNDSYIANSYLEFRDDEDERRMFQFPAQANGRALVQIDGYAIIPVERLSDLVKTLKEVVKQEGYEDHILHALELVDQYEDCGVHTLASRVLPRASKVH
jgi:hypothetical protein